MKEESGDNSHRSVGVANIDKRCTNFLKIRTKLQLSTATILEEYYPKSIRYLSSLALGPACCAFIQHKLDPSEPGTSTAPLNSQHSKSLAGPDLGPSAASGPVGSKLALLDFSLGSDN